MDFLENERDLKILADKTRLNILQLIYQGEQCGCELIHNLDITQPTLSHHLKVLSDAGFIVGEKEKNKILYSIKMDRIEEVFKQLLDAIICKKDCDI